MDATPGSPEDAAATNRRARESGAEWVVADGYSFSSSYQRSIQDAGYRLLLVDDDGDADGYPADMVLNQSLHAVPSLYGESYDRGHFLLGSNYALLREEFRPWIGETRTVASTPTRLLVSVGGFPDPAWLSRLLPGITDLDVDISVVGGLSSVSRGLLRSHDSIRFVDEVEDMAGLIMRNDIGLAAGGGTAKEFLFLGLPFAVVDVASNQKLQSRFLADTNLACWLGPIEELDTRDLRNSMQSLLDDRDERMRMSAAGQALIDGRGVDRVAARLTAYGRTR